MPYPIWPTSPVPASFTRDILWGESIQTFDSGREVGGSPWLKPLYKYSISLTNIPRIKQQSLHAFYNLVRGRSSPFLFSDPYDNRVNGAICVQSGSAVTSFFVRTSAGYPVIPVSGSLLITSALNGARTQGADYTFDPDTGLFTPTGAIAAGDMWTASCQYFRKCKFESYQESSQLWNSFNGQVVFHEIALP